MLAALALSLLASGPVSQLTEGQLNDQLEQAHKLPFPQRVDVLSKLFIGTGYGEFPLGDGGTGPEPWPRWRVDKVDCQTYVETVLAMANARNVTDAKAVLDDLRYSDAHPSFESRNHFTESQWLPANFSKGYLKDEVPVLDGSAPTEILNLRRAQWSQVPGLKRLAKANIPDGKYSVRYLPLEEAKKKAKSVEEGTVLMVVREHDPKRVVRISHMGFVVKGAGGKLVVRHASTGAEHAVLDEEYGEFLDKQSTYKSWKVVGVALAMPVDASLRVSQIRKGPSSK